MPLFTRKPLLLTELALFMIGLPLLLWLVLPPYVILPVVLMMALFCHHMANLVKMQRLGEWWHWRGITRAELMRVLIQFVVCAALLAAATYALAPELLFSFVRRAPGFWLAVMILYPLLSVVPQEIIFRRYLFTRFETIFTPAMMVLVSGLGFGFAHIVFNNWLAPALCAIGGLMFARTYQRTGSLALVSLEHALYGNFLFTLGLGRYFYHGAVVFGH